MIEKYQFGLIVIDGKEYTRDVEVRWTGEVLDWRRKESHIIDVEDVKRAVEQSPETIVIGTGESGVARVGEKVKEELSAKGIGLIIDITGEAAKTFNILKKGQKKAIGLFHLTC